MSSRSETAVKMGQFLTSQICSASRDVGACVGTDVSC